MENPSPADTKAASLPPQRSKTWGALILFIFLFAIASFVTKKVEKYPDKYNLAETPTGEILIIQVKPGHTAEIKLTNDWCPMWSDGIIYTYDSKGIERAMDGNYFILGPESTSTLKYTFKNKGEKNSVTVKIGHCESKDNCNVMF